jgi:GNAT superfamily N-acetyltransferase
MSGSTCLVRWQEKDDSATERIGGLRSVRSPRRWRVHLPRLCGLRRGVLAGVHQPDRGSRSTAKTTIHGHQSGNGSEAVLATRTPAPDAGPTHERGMNSGGDPIHIEYVADYPDLLPTIAAWVWRWWDFPSRAAAAAQLRREAQRGGVPSVDVAMSGTAPLGMVSLVECNLPARSDLYPWLAGLFVHRMHRRRGVGRALILFLERDAAGLGCRQVYLYTEVAEGFYRKLGWTTIERATLNREPVAIMAKSLGALSPTA